MRSPYIPAALRRLVVERADQQCEYCQMPQMQSPDIYESEHVVAHVVSNSNYSAASDAELILELQQRGYNVSMLFAQRKIPSLKTGNGNPVPTRPAKR